MPCKWCESNCKDMTDHLRKAKIKHFYATHEKRVTWGDEYIAPRESFGAWIEIKMVEDEWEKGTWHETWDFRPKLSKKAYTELMESLGSILFILTDSYSHSAPYIIQIDSVGKCHLISAKVDGEQKVQDEIFRTGKLEWVKVS